MSTDKKHKGFNIPEGYFENFEANLEIRLLEEELPKSNGFKVPDGYFDTLEERMAEIKAQPEPKVVSLFSRRSLVYVAGIAASLLLIISITKGSGDISEDIAALSLTEIESYLDQGGEDIDTDEILALMDEEALSEITLTSDLISEESLEEYLLENLEETSPLLIE